MKQMDRPVSARKLGCELPDIASDGDWLLMVEGFAERLRQLRKQKNLSQTEFAQLVGLHWNHIGRYERGTSRPSADALHKLAAVLGVSADYLIEGTTDDAAKASFQDRDLLRIFQEVETLDPQDKEVIKKLIEAFLMKRQLQQLAAR